MKGKCIMLMGTGSSVGKSILTAALCRIFKNDGKRVAPFKSQNMALNSYITKDGKEMGRAQVVQAEAAGKDADVRMNPILLKPTTDKKAQVIINGKVYKNMSATEYHDFKPQLADMIKNTYEALEAENDIIVIEGAGSPAEINLNDKDIVNMGMAKIADSPVILIGDIDKGGVFASIVGTIMLLSDEERKRVKGVIINKFRGDVSLLQSGINMLQDIIKIPVIGVIPYLDINIEDEDSVTERFKNKNNDGDIKIEIIRLPHISNFTDFVALETIDGVFVKYVKSEYEMSDDADLVIIPGSKNTISDMVFLNNSGIAKRLIKRSNEGKPIIGICGGFQMLGKKIFDPKNTESNLGSIDGLSLLDMTTEFMESKTTTRVKAKFENISFEKGILKGLSNIIVDGYEIHMGKSSFCENANCVLSIFESLGKKVLIKDGITNKNGNVFGTYLHGIFDNFEFTEKLIENLKAIKGIKNNKNSQISFESFKENEYNKLANEVLKCLDIKKIYEIINSWNEAFYDRL